MLTVVEFRTTNPTAFKFLVNGVILTQLCGKIQRFLSRVPFYIGMKFMLETQGTESYFTAVGYSAFLVSSWNNENEGNNK